MGKFEVWYDNVTEEERVELDALSKEDIVRYFSNDLEFGTAGIRGKMRLGNNALNLYTLKKVAQGFLKYLKKHYISIVVIGYDNRNNSDDFSKLMSIILKASDINVYRSEHPCSSPFLAYATRRSNNAMGVMITASHNHKDDNGLKVYGTNGAQIDDKLSNEIKAFIDETPICFKKEALDQKISNIPASYYQDYYNYILSLVMNKNTDFSNLNIVYTPQHGVGSYFTVPILKALKVNAQYVMEQMIPSGDFIIAPYPNPEDVRAFDLAKTYAWLNNADLLVSHDPDADRIGIMVLHQGQYVYLNGHQVGVLMLDYIMKNKSTSNGYVVKTVVTTPLIDAMCLKNNIECYTTLTGFKHLAAEVDKHPNKNFLLMFEEAIGYTIDAGVRDKDGHQALIILLEIAANLKKQNKTLVDNINEIYKEYNYYLDETINLIDDSAEGVKNIAAIVEKWRGYNSNEIAGVRILAKEDFLNMPGFPASNFIKFILEGNSTVIIRPSGTEPKLKYYFSINKPSYEDAKIMLEKLKKEVCK